MLVGSWDAIVDTWVVDVLAGGDKVVVVLAGGDKVVVVLAGVDKLVADKVVVVTIAILLICS